MTDIEREILTHALGLSHWHKEYRNHFVTGPECTEYSHCEELVKAGFMVRRDGSDDEDPVYFVTEAGRAALNNAN